MKLIALTSLLLATACANDPGYTWRLEGVPVDEATVAKVIDTMAKHTGRKVEGLTITVVAADHVTCGGLRVDGCTTDYGDHATIELDLYRDRVRGLITDGNMTCSILAHEMVHFFYGDMHHTNPTLWYDDGVLAHTFAQLGCPLFDR